MLAVRWYLRYALSYRDVEELLDERGRHCCVRRLPAILTVDLLVDEANVTESRRLQTPRNDFGGRLHRKICGRDRLILTDATVPQQALLSTGADPPPEPATSIIRYNRLGGLIHEYRQAAWPESNFRAPPTGSQFFNLSILLPCRSSAFCRNASAETGCITESHLSGMLSTPYNAPAIAPTVAP